MAKPKLAYSVSVPDFRLAGVTYGWTELEIFHRRKDAVDFCVRSLSVTKSQAGVFIDKVELVKEKKR